jgi:hypothetical protein
VSDDFRGPRFTAFGDGVAIHYPAGYTPGRDRLDAMAHALRIKRWHLANARVVASWDARRTAPVVDTSGPREATGAALLTWALRVLA